MKLLIIQPKLEPGLVQLRGTLEAHPEADAVLFPEGCLNENLEEARALAKRHRKILIGGYRRLNERPKDRAVLIDSDGEVLLDRQKYSETSFAEAGGVRIGHILCDELIEQGVKGAAAQEAPIGLLVHPIGVGMFSEEQFDEWIAAAAAIARTYRTLVAGTSHADGSFGGSDVSIPIAYAIAPDGEPIFIAKDDTRPRLFDTAAMTAAILPHA